MNNKVVVIGLGKVGQLVASFMKSSGFEVTGVDKVEIHDCDYSFVQLDLTDKKSLKNILESHNYVICCTPYFLNYQIAEIAYQTNTHYFDLTEDIKVRQKIRELSDKAKKSVLIPHCGLAPGYISILGTHLSHYFDKIDRIELRVGALPRHPIGKLGYAFNWSPIGLLNEYIHPCEMIDHGKLIEVSPLQMKESLVIENVQLEAFTTSGGLGTMCESYKGKCEHLSYKTIRYKGHCALMRFLLIELELKDKISTIAEWLYHAKPPVDDDVVFLHASVKGEKDGDVRLKQVVRRFYPKLIEKRQWRAISWTTAASVCAVVEMVHNGLLPQNGFIKQEDISYESFLDTRCGRLFSNN
jgi:saccharopine dehydrogenase-like NADP-dependent oxidoreductase